MLGRCLLKSCFPSMMARGKEFMVCLAATRFRLVRKGEVSGCEVCVEAEH